MRRLWQRGELHKRVTRHGGSNRNTVRNFSLNIHCADFKRGHFDPRHFRRPDNYACKRRCKRLEWDC